VSTTKPANAIHRVRESIAFGSGASLEDGVMLVHSDEG